MQLLTCEEPDAIDQILDQIAEKYVGEYNTTSEEFDLNEQPTCIKEE
jgi:hypothetical protein